MAVGKLEHAERVPALEIFGKPLTKLTSPIINGTIATTGLTMPAFTLGGTVTLNGQIMNAGAVSAKFLSSGEYGGIEIESTYAAGAGAGLKFYGNSASPAVGDDAMELDGATNNNIGTRVTFGHLRFRVTNVTSTTETGSVIIYLKNAGVDNLALQLTGPGVLSVDLAGTGTAAQVDLFDEYDDALELKATIQQRNRERGVELGLFYQKDTGSGYMMNIQPMIKLLAGAAYQGRALMDEMRQEFTARFEVLETKLLTGGGS